MATKTKTAYRYGVARDGLHEWMRESFYDRYTQAPRIIEVFATEAEAQAWIDREEAAAPGVMPGGRGTPIYGIYDLNTAEAYRSRQDCERFAVKVYAEKAALLKNLGKV